MTATTDGTRVAIIGGGPARLLLSHCLLLSLPAAVMVMLNSGQIA